QSKPSARKTEVKIEPDELPGAKELPAKPRSDKTQPVKTEPDTVAATHSKKIRSVKSEPLTAPAAKELAAANPQSEKIHSEKTDPGSMLPAQEPTINLQLPSRSMETASTRLADGFDFPVGKPEAEGYYKARGFRSGGHMGEDWDGIRGGDTDLNDPIYCIGAGVVVF